jgi:hypothetical protein
VATSCASAFAQNKSRLTLIIKLTGFADAVPVIREATVKSVLLVAPKLTDRILNNDLLRHLAKTQMDPEPGIRTNTCILLGRLSKFLQPATNSKVLIPAFSRAVRDAFVHARIAGLMALMATMECFSKEDLAGRVVPAMSITLVDKEKMVRDQAFRAMEMFVKKLESIAASMVSLCLRAFHSRLTDAARDGHSTRDTFTSSQWCFLLFFISCNTSRWLAYTSYFSSWCRWSSGWMGNDQLC